MEIAKTCRNCQHQAILEPEVDYYTFCRPCFDNDTCRFTRWEPITVNPDTMHKIAGRETHWSDPSLYCRVEENCSDTRAWKIKLMQCHAWYLNAGTGEIVTENGDHIGTVTRDHHGDALYQILSAAQKLFMETITINPALYRNPDYRRINRRLDDLFDGLENYLQATLWQGTGPAPDNKMKISEVQDGR